MVIGRGRLVFWIQREGHRRLYISAPEAPSSLVAKGSHCACLCDYHYPCSWSCIGGCWWTNRTGGKTMVAIGAASAYGAARGAAPTYLQGPSVPSTQPDSILTLSCATVDAPLARAAFSAEFAFCYIFARRRTKDEGRRTKDEGMSGHRGGMPFLREFF